MTRGIGDIGHRIGRFGYRGSVSEPEAEKQRGQHENQANGYAQPADVAPSQGLTPHLPSPAAAWGMLVKLPHRRGDLANLTTGNWAVGIDLKHLKVAPDGFAQFS